MLWIAWIWLQIKRPFRAVRDWYRQEAQWYRHFKLLAYKLKTSDEPSWPPDDYPSEFGNITNAKPKHGVQQDPELIKAVGEILEASKHCHACGRLNE